MNDQAATLRATIDNSGTKPQLVIEGTVLVYASDYDIDVRKAVPAGFNTSIFLVYATVRERVSPMKGVMQPFHLPPIPYSDDRWTSVQVTFQYEPEEGNEARIRNVLADIEGL